MSYYIQRYGKGFIQRNEDKYELNVDGEVAGSYGSVQQLVDANPLGNGKQVSEVVTESAEDNVVTSAPTKGATKAKTQRKAKK